MLQCVAVCCSVLQCVAVCCSAYHEVPFNERVVTVIDLVQIEPKNGFETDKVKDGYRLCGCLPQPPTSPPRNRFLL